MLEDKSDEELMLAYQLGDEIAFRALYARHSGRVFGFLRGKTKNEARARDIFQATFLKLHKSRSRYNSSFPFVPWLFTICRSELLDSFKKEKRLAEDILDDVPSPVVPETSSGQLELSVLNEKQQKAVEMRFQKDATFEEMAEALKVSPANARQILSRALRTLKGIYAKK